MAVVRTLCTLFVVIGQIAVAEFIFEFALIDNSDFNFPVVKICLKQGVLIDIKRGRQFFRQQNCEFCFVLHFLLLNNRTDNRKAIIAEPLS